jgi:hypothetical protein
MFEGGTMGEKASIRSFIFGFIAAMATGAMLLFGAWRAEAFLKPTPAELILPNSGIILPPQIDASEISNFEPEFCAPNSISGNVVKVCLGHARFQDAITIRALRLLMKTGEALVYVEKDLPGVELLRPRFEIVGPLGHEDELEVGRVHIQVDDAGEIAAVALTSPRLGQVSAVR